MISCRLCRVLFFFFTQPIPVCGAVSADFNAASLVNANAFVSQPPQTPAALVPAQSGKYATEAPEERRCRALYDKVLVIMGKQSV